MQIYQGNFRKNIFKKSVNVSRNYGYELVVSVLAQPVYTRVCWATG